MYKITVDDHFILVPIVSCHFTMYHTIHRQPAEFLFDVLHAIHENAEFCDEVSSMKGIDVVLL
jgi:hypothetical protein